MICGGCGLTNEQEPSAGELAALQAYDEMCAALEKFGRVE